MGDDSKFEGLSSILGVGIAIAVLLAIGVYLVATASPTKKGITTIRWAVDPNPIRPEQIRIFRKQHPNIDVMVDSGANGQSLLTQVAGGVTPDVMALYSPENIDFYARNNTLVDLRPYIKQYQLPIDRLYPALKPYVYYGDKIVGITENCGAYVLFYNKRLFREAGIPFPKENWTWDECFAAAQKLTKYQQVNGRQLPRQKGLYVANSDWWFFIWMYNGHLFSPDGKRCTMDSEAVKKGIRYWTDLRLKYHVLPTSSEVASMASTGAWGGESLLFQQEKVAMSIGGRWLSIQYRQKKDLDWDVTTVPHGSNRVTLLASKAYTIPRASHHRQEALLFLKNALTKENQMLIANYGDGSPSLQSPDVIKAFMYNPDYPNEKNNGLYIREMKYAHVPEMSPYINTVDVNAVMSYEMDRVWLGQQSPDQACDNIAERVNTIIQRNLANPNFLD